ncbi:MAG: 1-deoxy-D-xylulose-5-phosphate reductoisomerase [Candidatus Omnitrophica bacterium]|nr:1-deoxy-D-xylulose-5-phosphate reductoisomerase [Candidatus Omnitrophota bacterium]MBU3933688.1 1-deoxy-D-xylulose-5-phosphate reductoisomerase [Candidatus Omnitrophota bacterium]MBU4140369.1 1-deoxy-D-xylulose-5-phosphate reductoisomerase [Candidatus Omnitrophota bacterium]
MKTIAIFGSTGSIGKNTLEVISQLGDNFKVVALAAGRNAPLLAEQVNRFRPQLAAIMDESKFPSLKKAVNARTKLLAGREGIDAAADCGADIVVMAVGGSAALLPTLRSLEKSRRLALANKESLVMAGDIIMRKSKEYGVEVIPIDSEHSAIFQCLKDEGNSSLEKIYLTGSGGPLKDVAKEALEFVEPEFALRHPRWNMGKKISIDSATLMNKGFEVIEANYLFNLAPERIEVLIHPQAIVHSLVQFVDGSILAQLGIADMRIPIQYALTYPHRMPAALARLDFSKIEKLFFQRPDLTKFPCLELGMQVARQKGLAGAVLCACDEECVAAFLEGKIKLTAIARIIEDVLAKLKNKIDPALEEILQIDKWAREQVKLRM